MKRAFRAFLCSMLSGAHIPVMVLAQNVSINEIVAAGSGTPTEKKKLGNTVAIIEVDSLADATASNLSELLQGRVAGMEVAHSLGIVGASAHIRLRGSASLMQTNEPLLYLDGVRMDNSAGFSSRLNDINIEAVERIEILKGAAAAGLYESRAAAGVIHIFTKTGAFSKPQFSFHIDQAAVTSPEVIKPNAGFARDESQLANMRQVFNDPGLQLYQPVQRNFVDDLFGTGHRQTYSLSLTGGGKVATYFLNGRYNTIAGPYNPEAEDFLGQAPGGLDNLSRSTQLQGNFTLLPTGRFRLRFRSMYSNIHQESPEIGKDVNSRAVFHSPTTLAMLGKPELVTPTNTQGTPHNIAFSTVRDATLAEIQDSIKHAVIGLSTSYHLSEEISFDGAFGMDYVDQDYFNLIPLVYGGYLAFADRESREFTTEVKGIWKRHITAKTASKLIIGFQRFASDEVFSEAAVSSFGGLPDRASVRPFPISFETSNTGWFLQEQIGYDDYLYLNAGIRFDSFNAFGLSSRRRAYPHVSVSFVPSSAWHWAGALLSTVRLRGAFGQTGETSARVIGFGLSLPDTLNTEKLKPEVATEWELGLDAGLFKDRLGLELTYWNRSVEDAFNIQTSNIVIGGPRWARVDNFGKWTAHGLELTANLQALKKENLAIEVFAHSAFLSEKIRDFGDMPVIGLQAGDFGSRYRNFIQEGYAPGAFFGAKLADGDLPIDVNNDGKSESREALLAFFSQPRDPFEFKPLLADKDSDGRIFNHYLGKPTPDWQGAFGCNVSFLKHFRLSSRFEYKAGNYTIHNLTDEFRTSEPYIGRNTPEAAATELILLNPASTPVERLAAAANWVNEFAGISSYYAPNVFEKGDYLRWRELSLTYDLPQSFIGNLLLKNASITFAGRNLALFSGYSGIDPETAAFGNGANYQSSTDAFFLPLPRQFVFSLRAGF